MLRGREGGGERANGRGGRVRWTVGHGRKGGREGKRRGHKGYAGETNRHEDRGRLMTEALRTARGRVAEGHLEMMGEVPGSVSIRILHSVAVRGGGGWWCEGRGVARG